MTVKKDNPERWQRLKSLEKQVAALEERVKNLEELVNKDEAK